ncbi:MAG: EamA family transporter [Flavobacteriales bacterium CG18_big_fil_WC_8_21_14_2_50_32_9]|nr:MAG: EamA family transporter [Flavobacteriales bacterium CG18_big_fil_WC_8_21_14_2_50_32_9]
MSSNLKPHLALFGANLIYGANYSIAKDVMPNFIHPFGLVLCRVIGAVVLFWFIYAFSYEKVAKKDFLLLGLCGLFGVAANQLMFLYGLDNTTPINAGIIMVSNPIMVLIASAIILKNKITITKVSGIALGIIGALLLLLFKGNFSFGSENLKGDIFIFLNAMSYGIYLVIAVPLMRKYKPITVMSWVFAFGLIMVFPFGFEEFKQIEWVSFTPIIWWKFIFIVVATTFLAYLFNIYGLKRLSPSIVSTYIYLQPLLATLIAIWVGKDSLDMIKISAALFIFTGVYLVSKTKRKVNGEW